MNIFIELFFIFAKIGAVTFGGGYAMLPILQREVVDSKHWVKDEELMDYYAIGQCTPGVIAVNVSTFIGNKLAGIPGGIVATLGVITPSVIFITIISLIVLNTTYMSCMPLPGSVPVWLCSFWIRLSV